MNETSQCIAGGPLVCSSVFSFSMIKRRENEGGKAFFGFFKLVLTMLFFTDKNLTQTIDSNDINIYLPSFTIRNR